MFTLVSEAGNMIAYLSWTGLLAASGRSVGMTVAVMVSGGLAAVPVGRGSGFFVTLLTNGPRFILAAPFAPPGVGARRYPPSEMVVVRPSSNGSAENTPLAAELFNAW